MGTRLNWHIVDDAALLAAVLAQVRARGDRRERLAKCLRYLHGQADPREARVSRKVQALAERGCGRGAALARIYPHGSDQPQWAFVQNIGNVSGRESFTLINSRKPRVPDGTAAWARTTVALAQRESQERVLIASLEPLPFSLAAYAAAQSGRPALIVHPAGAPATLEGARLRAFESLVDGWPETGQFAWVAPLRCVLAPDRADAWRERDRFVVGLADRLIAVSVRAGGGFLDLALARLKTDASAVQVAAPSEVESEGVDVRGNESLIAAGAREINIRLAAGSGKIATKGIGERGNPPAWEHFAHHTADQEGPWPGETRGQFLESLCRGDEPSRRDAFQTLLRIAREGRIRAGIGGLRQPKGTGAARNLAVCFTELPPSPAHPFHRYDPARHRWLFGPCAVCVRRSAAEAAGVRPALYRQSEEYDALSAEERFRFQLHEPPRVDRSAEREWRVPEDLDLRAFDEGDVLFVTRTADEAAQIMAVSPWPAWPVERFDE